MGLKTAIFSNLKNFLLFLNLLGLEMQIFLWEISQILRFSLEISTSGTTGDAACVTLWQGRRCVKSGQFHREINLLFPITEGVLEDQESF